jgi:hypothetical protein
MNQREQVALDVPPKRRLTKYLHDATSQMVAFFIVTAVITSNLTINYEVCGCKLLYQNLGYDTGV